MKRNRRANLHVLTSIDYAKMSAEDKALESNPRSDHDYGLSWMRREGQGRFFYEAHGHSERVYAMRPMHDCRARPLKIAVRVEIGDEAAAPVTDRNPARVVFSELIDEANSSG